MGGTTHESETGTADWAPLERTSPSGYADAMRRSGIAAVSVLAVLVAVGPTGAAGAPIVAPGITLGSVVADFESTCGGTTAPRATWQCDFDEGDESWEATAELRLRYTVSGCDQWSSSEEMVQAEVSGRAVVPWGFGAAFYLCGSRAQELSSVPRVVTGVVAVDEPTLPRTQTRSVFLSTRKLITDQLTPIGQLRIRYTYKRLYKRKVVRYWEGTDAFWNVCVRGSGDVFMRDGRRYCDDVTPAAWRVRLSFVGPRVLGG